MFRASTAHHQEVSCIYVANGTSKGEPGWNGMGCITHLQQRIAHWVPRILFW
jgi:hypothetical protein